MLDLNKEDNFIRSVNYNYVFYLYWAGLSLYIFQRRFKVFKVYLL